MKGLMVILVGCSAAFFCSCKKSCGMSYVTEILTDGQFSGAGYTQWFGSPEGELTFAVSSRSASTVKLTIRGRGRAEAQIVANGHHATVAFDDSDRWQEVTAPVQLHAGENLIAIKQMNAAASPLMVDYIEINQ